jgi:hypothetical protein
MGVFQNGFQKTSIEKNGLFQNVTCQKDGSFCPVFRKRIQKETGGGCIFEAMKKFKSQPLMFAVCLTVWYQNSVSVTNGTYNTNYQFQVSVFMNRGNIRLPRHPHR